MKKNCETMKIKGNIKFKYKNEKDAENIYNSLEIDNENYLESKYDQKEINYIITSENLGSFLATADDLISSEIVSEKIIKNTSR